MSSPAMVFIIDDDADMRNATQRLLKSVGLSTEVFAAPQDFLRHKPDVPSCLILDVRLPGISGLEVQRQLFEAGVHIPIIFITAHADIPMTVQAMKSGAVESLQNRSGMRTFWMQFSRFYSATKLHDSSRTRLENCGKGTES